MTWVMYLLGWALFLALQIQNSLRSNTNGLEFSLSGVKRWLQISAVQTMLRAFIVVIFFPALMKGPVAKLNATLMASGFEVTTWGLAGLAGLASEALLYQVWGLIPGLRKEVAAVAPPPSDLPK
jgi:hypothetical protein